MKFGNLNFLIPSGPVQACNGTAFFYTIILTGRQYDLPDPMVDSDADTFVEICLGDSEK